jgi:hypothetical protein
MVISNFKTPGTGETFLSQKGCGLPGECKHIEWTDFKLEYARGPACAVLENCR